MKVGKAMEGPRGPKFPQSYPIKAKDPAHQPNSRARACYV
jgi:hypothetical protein